MMLAASAYSPEEIDAIAGWLGEEFSATEIANRLSALRRSPISRNAIIGVVHRNKKLSAIGLAGRAGNIRGKKEGRAFDPPFAPPKPRHIDDGIAPHVYDATTRHVAIGDLKAGECRWPVNAAAPGELHLFCGKPSGLSSYCPHHCRRAGSGYLAAQTRDVRSEMKRSA